MSIRSRGLRAAALACAGLVAASSAWGAGFGIFEQGSKAMGMGGAFAAQADDPSAMFHNVGGLAFLDEREFQVGTTLIHGSGTEFQGGSPFPGPGVTETMADLFETPPHFYWVEPINDRMTFGLAVNSPFGLSTKWDDPAFSGRFVSREASVVTLDLNPNLAWKVNDRLGVGVGLMLRSAKVELTRNQGLINPFTANVVDVAEVDLESDFDQGFGFQVGLRHQPNDRVTWGVAYRGAVDTDFSGDARFTQIPTGNPQLDALVAATLPLGQDLAISTELEFPDLLMLGVAVRFGAEWLVELDANRTGWSSMDEVVIDFGGALPPLVLPQHWDDANNYRLGARRKTGARSEWRVGFLFDETPQPLENVGPLLPDGDRRGLSVGYGYQGPKKSVDLALLYLPLEKRTTAVNESGFNGTYDSQALLLGVTVGW